ncbi:hypothetical protein JOY44_27390 (plasmid) [Phormidium sp. CLA17]|uniref:SDR family NAD(P)-dependent oxidoreductase n=1 Tax=Leptolyngbya sp. Cla-17 TaxID=2803751 RepID=UPI00149152E0|nr:SDR family NAD(P)-dependent oxidoreductase [Leptolyngbya sp. Cla-17]MBM0745202.1 hypothetical protein [Leptolyngbya sp. Cla-17]
MTPTEEQNLAIAERLWFNGASIAITYAGNREKAEAVIETIKKNGMHAIAIQANLSHTDEVTKLFDAAQ